MDVSNREYGSHLIHSFIFAFTLIVLCCPYYCVDSTYAFYANPAPSSRFATSHIIFQFSKVGSVYLKRLVLILHGQDLFGRLIDPCQPGDSLL